MALLSRFLQGLQFLDFPLVLIVLNSKRGRDMGLVFTENVLLLFRNAGTVAVQPLLTATNTEYSFVLGRDSLAANTTDIGR